MSDPTAESDARVHKFIVNNLNDTPQFEAGDTSEDLGLLSKALSTLANLKAVRDISKVMHDAHQKIRSSSPADLGKVLLASQRELLKLLPTKAPITPSKNELKVSGNMTADETAALRCLVTKIVNAEKANREREGQGFQGKEGGTYAGDEDARCKGASEQMADLFRDVVSSPDIQSAADRFSSMKHGLPRLSRALIAHRPKYVNHWNKNYQATEESIKSIENYTKSLETIVEGFFYQAIGEKQATRVKPVFMFDKTKRVPGKFLHIIVKEGQHAGDPVSKIVDIENCISVARGQLLKIVGTMRSNFEAHVKSQELLEDDQAVSVGDINNLAMVRYDAIVLNLVLETKVLEKLASHFGTELGEEDPFFDVDEGNLNTLYTELDIDRRIVLENASIVTVACEFVLNCFAMDHDSLFMREKPRIGRIQIKREIFKKAMALDSKISSKLSDKFSSLLIDTRSRPDQDYHLPFTATTFARVERACSIFIPLAGPFGFIVGSTNKLLAICALVDVRGDAGQSDCYLAHQLLACAFTCYYQAKFRIEGNLFDKVKVTGDAGSPPDAPTPPPPGGQSGSSGEGGNSGGGAGGPGGKSGGSSGSSGVPAGSSSGFAGGSGTPMGNVGNPKEQTKGSGKKTGKGGNKKQSNTSSTPRSEIHYVAKESNASPASDVSAAASA